MVNIPIKSNSFILQEGFRFLWSLSWTVAEFVILNNIFLGILWAILTILHFAGLLIPLSSVTSETSTCAISPILSFGFIVIGVLGLFVIKEPVVRYSTSICAILIGVFQIIAYLKYKNWEDEGE